MVHVLNHQYRTLEALSPSDSETRLDSLRIKLPRDLYSWLESRSGLAEHGTTLTPLSLISVNLTG